MKDYTLFAVSKLLQHCDSRKVIPASVTELHLSRVTASVVDRNLIAGSAALRASEAQLTAFELKIEASLHKIFLSQTCSLLNCLLLSKKLVQQGKLSATGGADLLLTWQG